VAEYGWLTPRRGKSFLMEKELAALRHLFPARKDSPHPVADLTSCLRFNDFLKWVVSTLVFFRKLARFIYTYFFELFISGLLLSTTPP